MPAYARAMYVLLGVLALAASTIVLVAPSLVVDASQPGIVTHLLQEQAAAFVFVGLMFLWCARHPAERRPVHGALTLFLALYAAVHWWGVLETGDRLLGALATTVPVAVLGLSWPRSAGAPSAAKRA
jgi:hypothetical protein